MCASKYIQESWIYFMIEEWQLDEDDTLGGVNGGQELVQAFRSYSEKIIHKQSAIGSNATRDAQPARAVKIEQYLIDGKSAGDLTSRSIGSRPLEFAEDSCLADRWWAGHDKYNSIRTAQLRHGSSARCFSISCSLPFREPVAV